MIVACAASLAAIASAALGAERRKPLMPDLNRLDPLAGMGRLFTKDSSPKCSDAADRGRAHRDVATTGTSSGTTGSVVALMRQPSR